MSSRDLVSVKEGGGGFKLKVDFCLSVICCWKNEEEVKRPKRKVIKTR